MDTQDYFGSFNAGVSPVEAIQNICNDTGWWSRNLSGKTHEQEEIFTVRFGKTWATMKISELMPEKKVPRQACTN